MNHPEEVTQLVAALDSGTQSTRCFLFDINMHPVACHNEPITQIYPHAGWVEHDPCEIAEKSKVCMAMALSLAQEKLGPVKVVSIGITNQRETTIVWSKTTGLPLYNAVVWSDGRTSEICSRLEALGGKDRFRPTTGLPVSTYFSAYKFLWMYENVPDVKASVDSGDALVGTVDSWLIYELTGGARNGGLHLTDATNASRTNLMSLATLDWHDEFLPLFHLSRSALPRIISNSELCGHVTSGPMSGVPIMGCLGDQQAALLGQRCIEGEAKNTYGTGCFLLLNTGKNPVPSSHGLLTTLGYKLGPEKEACYALEGSVAVGGMGFSWLRDNLHIIDSPEEAQTLASSVDDTAGVYFVPAFSGLMAPRWIDSARGVIVGLTLASTRAHICRAMHEAIAFQSLEVLNAMIKDSGIGKLSVLRVDGGAVQNSLLMQMQASIAQTDVQVPQFRETTALGAALASGLAAGFWTEGQVFAHPYSFTSYHPKMTADEADKKLASWCKAVSISLDLASL